MKKLKFSVCIFIFAAAFLSLFLCWDCVSKGVTKGMYLCVNIVIPSLFPSLCLCSIFIKTSLVDRLARLFKKPSAVLFRLNGYALPIFLLSLISGYPVGTAVASALYDCGTVNRSARDKIALISCSGGPAFVVLAVGVGMLGSYEKGIVLLISHISASVLTACAVSRFYKPDTDFTPKIYEKKTFSDAVVGGVSSATVSIISICAFTVIFSAVVSVASVYLQGSVFYTPLITALEVTNACYALSSSGVSLAVISAALGFGGLSVICQVVSVSGKEKLSFSAVCAVRALHAVFSYCITTGVLMIYDIPQPIIKNFTAKAIISEKDVYFSLSLIILAVVFLISVAKQRTRADGSSFTITHR